MASLDRLAPDQRAALMLILQQGQTYEDLAQLLATDTAAVRARAHAAVDAIGPGLASELDPVQRGEVADYLLGQQTYSQRESTRALLASSAPARNWARAVSAELAPLTKDALPGTAGPSTPPGEGRGARSATPGPPEAGAAQPPADEGAAVTSAAQRRAARRAAAAGAGGDVSAGDVSAGESAAEAAPPPSAATDDEHDAARPALGGRVGGIVLVALAAIVIVVGVILLANSGGGSSSKTGTDTISTPAGAAGSSGPSGPSGTTGARVQVISNVPLQAGPGTHAQGAAEVVQQVGTSSRAFLIAGTGLTPTSANSAYAVWLYNSQADAQSLGFFTSTANSKGQIEGTAAVPANASRYKQLIITRETTSRPAHPGQIVLSGTLKLG